jgi:hypothetical protein
MVSLSLYVFVFNAFSFLSLKSPNTLSIIFVEASSARYVRKKEWVLQYFYCVTERERISDGKEKEENDVG